MVVTSNDSLFVMHGARDAITRGLLHIETQVKALELAVIENTGLAFDLAKSLVESACKTIITERGGTFDKDDDLPKIFKIVKNSVPFLPDTVSGETGVRKSLEQTLNGLSTALQGVCELRNACGFASHGSNSPHPVMDGIQALLVAQAADAIIGFLYRVHHQDLSRPRSDPLKYDHNTEFNEWIDNQCEPIQILSHSPYSPSEVLFNLDRVAYRELLINYENEIKSEEQANQDDEKEIESK